MKTKLLFRLFFYFRGHLKNVKKKATRKTCFSFQMKPLAFRLYLAKFNCIFIELHSIVFVKSFKSESLSVTQ